ncbi:Hypothetical_protein [Hexamita inflata]|uniref:Hypothetical_protein n=1 Tax=Hexamita inflata TaxID=28002 RepID=A0AA86PNL6_9EUKA|nr:Hypothetical protein HINF_LOCUS29187 [Hexamita inflata]
MNQFQDKNKLQLPKLSHHYLNSSVLHRLLVLNFDWKKYLPFELLVGGQHNKLSVDKGDSVDSVQFIVLHQNTSAPKFNPVVKIGLPSGLIKTCSTLPLAKLETIFAY